MKRTDLLRKFKKNGWWIEREGGRHTIVTDGVNKDAIPRHKEINELTAIAIIKRWGLK
jgi:mRNA interferase HicA